MHQDLEQLSNEFAAASARLHQLSESVSDAAWSRRPAQGRWSIDECVAHLTITNDRYLPLLQEAAASAPPLADPARPLHRDIVGRLLCTFMEPPVRLRLPTAATFEPPTSAGRAVTVARFDATQDRLLATIRGMDGRDLGAVRMQSPFDARVKYSLYSALCILAAHERRHLWQAEQVRDALRATA